MFNLLALYRGKTLGEVKTIVATSDRKIIQSFVEHYLQRQKGANNDPSLDAIDEGTRKALEEILKNG